MIKKIEALYFKGFKHINIDFNSYNLLVGPNASGKSSLIDIFRFVKDVLSEGPEIAVQKRSASFNELVWKQSKNYFEFVFEFKLPEELNHIYSTARYEIAISQSPTEGITIANEHLWLIKEMNGSRSRREKKPEQLSLFPREFEAPEHIITIGRKAPVGWRKVISKSEKGNDYFKSEKTDWNIIYRFGPQKASLARVPEDESRFSIAIWLKNVLMEGVQFIQLNSEKMRWACRPDTPVYFEPDGSNLPKVVKHLKENYPNKFKMWLEHIRTALKDIRNIEINERQEDRFLYLTVTYDNGIKVPSWLLSDGTLRFLAQTLIAYLPDKNKIYMIEEPENGLHPQAIESVVQSLSSIYDNTVILATHSPIVLQLAEPKDILCFSKTESGAIDIVRGSNHPRLKDWKNEVDLATLHAAGVLQ